MKENWFIMCFKYKSNHVKKQSIHKIPPKVKRTTYIFFVSDQLLNALKDFNMANVPHLIIKYEYYY